MSIEIINCEQGTDEWLQCRLGTPTASCFDKIITPTGKPSAQAEAYMNTLLAELITGLPDGMEPTEWMQHGTDMEPEARLWYEMDRDVEVQQVGFVRATGYGCSPDGLVADDGLVEIKCPKPSTHVGYMLDDKLPTKYTPQIQGQLWVCERDWCDFLSYAPGMEPVVVRVGRDKKFIKALADRMDWFLERFREKKQRLIKRGQLQQEKVAA